MYARDKVKASWRAMTPTATKSMIQLGIIAGLVLWPFTGAEQWAPVDGATICIPLGTCSSIVRRYSKKVSDQIGDGSFGGL